MKQDSYSERTDDRLSFVSNIKGMTGETDLVLVRKRVSYRMRIVSNEEENLCVVV